MPITVIEGKGGILNRIISWKIENNLYYKKAGALLVAKIKESDKSISMLVASNNSTFTKKAIGKITFICYEGKVIDEAIIKAIQTGEGQTFWMQSIGTNEEGIEVSKFNFEWTIKVKS